MTIIPPPAMLRCCNNHLLMSSKRVVIPDEVIEEILSFLPVKSLLQLRCVCKSWKILISDPIFIKLHLKRSSARNPHITLLFSDNSRILPFPVHRLLNHNTSISISRYKSNYPNFQLQRTDYFNGFICFVGSHNGLLCFVQGNDTGKTLFYLWNPATNTLSNKSTFAFDRSYPPWNFAFGYDNSANTYKIVGFHRMRNKVKVFNFSNNVCRNIEAFPVVPFHNCSLPYIYPQGINDGVYVSNTINWLAILLQFQVEQFVIISLDLSTETYRHLSPPQGFSQDMTSIKLEPTLAVLMDSLCFSHHFNGTHFIIWQMKQYGVQDSWTQFFKFNYQILPVIDCRTSLRDFSEMALFPLWLSKNGDTLILAWTYDSKSILYNLRDNTAVKIRIRDNIKWFLAKDYVESLVPTFSDHG